MNDVWAKGARRAMIVLGSALALAGCELTDYFAPNPDARTLYSEPFIGLRQLQSLESRLLPSDEVAKLRGQLRSDAESLSTGEALAPQAAREVLNPPRAITPINTDALDTDGLTVTQRAQLANRQREADVELGIFREAAERAEQIATERAQAEARRAEQLARLAEANRQLQGELLPRREVAPVPQPERPTRLADLFTDLSDGEQPIAIVYFQSGSDALGRREEVTIRTIARQLNGRGFALNVRGYDSGSLANRTNADRARALQLSRRRAQAVVAMLVDSGFPAEDIQSGGFGDQQPVFPEASEVGVYANQRVEITAQRKQPPAPTPTQ